MQWIFAPLFRNRQAPIEAALLQWEQLGYWWVKGARNGIKVIPFEGMELSVKVFKIPHVFNAIGYKYFRKSKARRSFEYAVKLQQLGIGTPEPIAYAEHMAPWGLRQSYYVCQHLRFDWMFRDLVETPEQVPHIANILQQFGAFCYQLHQQGVEFLDHSPGNTLICQTAEGFAFYLVDLNRMHFDRQLDVKARMKNLSHLTPHRDMVKAIAQAYAQASGEDPQELDALLWSYTHAFQTAYYRKKRWKKRIFFWK